MQVSLRTDRVRSVSPRPLLHQWFEARAAEQGQAIAVRCGTEQLTYAELEARANQLAGYLRQLGVGAESLVALYLERGIPMIVSILATLKAGGAYVPIDRSYPPDRVQFVLADADPVVVITTSDLLAALPLGGSPIVSLDTDGAAIARQPTNRLPDDADGNRAAYVIYTSGSTGRPKGVVVTHHNVVRLFTATEQWFHFCDEDVWSLFHSFAFDFSVWELWGALLYGGKLVVVPYVVSRSPEAFYTLLVQEKVTVLNQTPSAFRQLMWADEKDGIGEGLMLRWVIFGGEALELQSLRSWFNRHGDQQPALVNMYGITETTVHVTFRPIRKADLEADSGSVIGQPIPDLTVHILDENRHTCPVGQAGEIYVGGEGVARGYLRRPELTAERFIPDPFSGSPGARLYRSGDLARRLPDGDMEYLGRADQQVKIRGFRIELGEIEAALGVHPDVRECAAAAVGDRTGDQQLVAWLVSSLRRPSVEEFRTYLRERLPDYMIPAHFIFLERLPLTVNGKIDRRALPRPGNGRPEMGVAMVLARTEQEKVLSAIWQEVLGLCEVGIHDNFFALGGDSIRSIQVLARSEARGIKLSLEQLFATPTIYDLARAERGPEESTSPGPERSFAGIPAEDRARLPDGIEDAYPMAQLQVGMVYHSGLDPSSAIFHDVFSFRFQLPFDRARFERAVERLVQRHSIFRTSFDLGRYGQPLQMVHTTAAVPLTVDDLSGLDGERQSRALVDWVETEKRTPFDWAKPPFLRLHVQRYGDGVFQLVVSFHHAIMDGWSLAAMLTELFQDYAAALQNRVVEIPTPAITYRDFVRLEAQAADSAETCTFWKRTLEGATIHKLPRWPASLRRGGREQVRGPEWVVAPEVLRGLQALAHGTGVPLRTVLLAAHARVMSIVTGQADITTGLVANGRPQTGGGERVIGLFLNTVPVRLTLEGGSWRELVEQTFAAERGLLPHRRCPLAAIQNMTGGRELFETVFDFVQFHVYRDLPGYGDHTFLEDHYFEANNFTFYMTFMLDADGTQLQLHCDYDPNELCPPQIQLLTGYYVETLTAMARGGNSRYESHSPLSNEERQRLLSEWNGTRRDYPQDICVHELISRQASLTPDSVAAACHSELLTYAELEAQTSRLAAHLRDVGVVPGVLVGVHVGRSLRMLVTVLAVLKAGGAYVPLDPSFPRARLEYMVRDAGIELVLSDASEGVDFAGANVLSVIALLAAPQPQDSLRIEEGGARPEDLAYVIYTSGSTGLPKGVEITHRALVNFLASMREKPGLAATDRLLAVTTLSFDIAALELFLPLTVGARVIIADEETVHDPEALMSILEREGVTTMQATPTTWRLLVQNGWVGNRRLKALCGGEALPRELATVLLERVGELWNMYGPTETTVWSSVARVVGEDGPVSIGRAIANTEIYLLDACRNPVPTGSEGELYIGGDGLARGYLRRPELTEEKFVPHPFRSGERLYRTGDLARFLPDGRLICVGRTDHQVKIRGFRIELEEIEASLLRYPGIAAAVVVAREDPLAGKRLLAYYVTEPGAAVLTGELRRHLEASLPSYMIPAAFMDLPVLPLTPNGKVDRQQLPEPVDGRVGGDEDFVPPQTPLEEQIATVWKEALNVHQISRTDDFFRLGGHSLLVVHVIGKLRYALQLDLSISLLFEHATLESFAMAVAENLLQQEMEMTELEDPSSGADGADGMPAGRLLESAP